MLKQKLKVDLHPILNVTSTESMESQTPTAEGAAVPTPPAGMSPQDSAPEAQPKQEAKPAELTFIEETLGREFPSLEEARASLKNLNSLVGDQTISKQRKALEKIARQANLTPEELLEVVESQETQDHNGTAETPVESPTLSSLPDDTTKRLTRIETDTFVKDNPEAAAVRDQLFAEALQTGRPVQDLWATRFAPLIEVGKKHGARKLQNTLEGQPTRATSTASETDDTRIDFSKMSVKDMEKHLGYTPTKPGI